MAYIYCQYIAPGSTSLLAEERCQDSRILAIYARPTMTPQNIAETHPNVRAKKEKHGREMGGKGD